MPGAARMPRMSARRWLALLLTALILGAAGGFSDSLAVEVRSAAVQSLQAAPDAASGEAPTGQEECGSATAVQQPADTTLAHPTAIREDRRADGPERLAGAAGCRGPDQSPHNEVDLYRLQVLRT